MKADQITKTGLGVMARIGNGAGGRSAAVPGLEAALDHRARKGHKADGQIPDSQLVGLAAGSWAVGFILGAVCMALVAAVLPIR